MSRQHPCEPRYCAVCGELIPRGNYAPSDYKTKTTCGKNQQAHLPKEEQCWYVYVLKVRPNNFKRPPHHEIKLKTPEPVKKVKLSVSEAERLDAEQAKIDRAIFEKIANRWVSSPVRILEEWERRELEKIYTPPTGPKTELLPYPERERPYQGGISCKNSGMV